MPTPSNDLLVARRALEGERGVLLLEDLRWWPSHAVWSLRVSLEIETPSKSVPQSSDWYVLLRDDYPFGEIDICPARDGGMHLTFRHQTVNGPGDPSTAWRTGRLCVDFPGAHLHGIRAIGETLEPAKRLLWNIARAREWLQAAASGALTKSGEPYETPQVCLGDSETNLLYAEDARTFTVWEGRAGRSGRLVLAQIDEETVAVCALLEGDTALVIPPWGKVVETAPRASGFWLLLPEAPLVSEWTMPSIWGELREACSKMRVDLDGTVKQIALSVRRLQRSAPVLLLIGFPIPKNYGGEPIEVHWQALVLPQLTTGSVPGFRNNENSRNMLDRMGPLANGKPLNWVNTQNVSEEHLSVRGELPPGLKDSRCALIGCGSLGSAIADLLVRKGLRQLNLFDGEKLQVGNLRRHVLTLSEVGQNKAAALAARLNAASLFADVDAVPLPISTTRMRELVAKHDLIIDTSAADRVAHHLGRLPETGEHTFFAFSVGAYARSLFAFGCRGSTFAEREYLTNLDPEREREVKLLESDPTIRDVGCHNPTFPAPYDLVWTQATRAVRFMECFVESAETMRFDRVDGP